MKAVRDGITTYYIYDMNNNVIAETDVNKTVTKYYIHGSGLLAMVTPTDQAYSYHFNSIGTTIALTDQNQSMVNKYAYDEFGVIFNQQETISQPFKYVGQYGVMVEPNGFYYMRARYYDPKVGRFISEDPIGFEGGDVNLMRYVGNNVVNKIDPSGKIWICGDPEYFGACVPSGEPASDLPEEEHGLQPPTEHECKVAKHGLELLVTIAEYVYTGIVTLWPSNEMIKNILPPSPAEAIEK